MHQWTHLGGRGAFVDGAEIARRTVLDRLGQVHQRLESPAHGPVDGQRGGSHQHQVGQQHPQEQLLSPLLAGV